MSVANTDGVVREIVVEIPSEDTELRALFHEVPASSVPGAKSTDNAVYATRWKDGTEEGLPLSDTDARSIAQYGNINSLKTLANAEALFMPAAAREFHGFPAIPKRPQQMIGYMRNNPDTWANNPQVVDKNVQNTVRRSQGGRISQWMRANGYNFGINTLAIKGPLIFAVGIGASAVALMGLHRYRINKGEKKYKTSHEAWLSQNTLTGTKGLIWDLAAAPVEIGNCVMQYATNPDKFNEKWEEAQRAIAEREAEEAKNAAANAKWRQRYNIEAFAPPSLLNNFGKTIAGIWDARPSPWDIHPFESDPEHGKAPGSA